MISMGADLGLVAKAQALSIACNQLFGFSPQITYTDKQAIIRFTKDQNAVIRDYFNKSMDDKNPPELDFDLPPIVGPWVLKSAAPWFIGAAALGLVLGYSIK